MAEIKIVDQSMRDGQQSWWGMRMRPGHMLEMASAVDKAGFHVVEFSGSAIFEVWLRQFREDPWTGFDQVRQALPNTHVRSGLRPNASAGSGFTLTPRSVIDLYINTCIRHGTDSFWIYDCLYNMDLMKRVSQVIVNGGAKAVPTLMFSLSEFHTDEFFADKVRQIVSWRLADAIELEDASGVLTPERAKTLLPVLQEAAAGTPLEMHFHNTTGLAPLNYLIAVDLGIDVLHTASDPVANGVSLPSVEQTLANLEHLGHTTGLDHTMLPAMAEHLVSVARSEGYEIGRPAEYDISTYSHQMPGGATGTLKSQLDQHGLTHRLSETLEEAARVHKELGSPVMATPISQLVSIQALLNVTLGKRYASVPDDVVFYVLGRLGTPPGPIDDNVKDKILGTARARELAAWEQPEPTLDDLRQEHGINLTDEELWLRAVMQRSVIDAMRDHGPASMKWRPSPKSPAAALIEAMGNTVCGDSLSYQSADLTFELRRR